MQRRNTDFMLYRVVAGLSLLFWVASADAAGFAAAEPTSVEVDRLFADVQKSGSPGCALAVLRDGNIIYSKGYGLASVELNAPITPHTVFDIGSTSKQFTASSIVLLEQQGKLSVKDDVRKYIPELPDYSQNGGRKITILDLLNHTSGLRDYLSLLQLSGVSADSVTTDDDALALIIRQKGLNFAPGSEWAYSNTGFFLLSVIVKRVSGVTLREFASQNIFKPLEMTHTTFRDDHTMLLPNRGLAYDPGENGGYKLDVSYYEQLGDGAVHTSVEDLAKWDENFYSARVGGKAFLAEMQEPGKLNSGKVLDYAKGLFIQDQRGLHTVRHGGALGGYRAELLRFPGQHFSVACLCNLANADPERRADQVAQLYLGSLMKPEEHAPAAKEASHKSADVTLNAAEMKALTGSYRDENMGTIARVSSANGKLQLEMYGRTFGLRALSATEFVIADPPIDAKLTFELEGHSARLMKTSGHDVPAGTYEAVTEFAPSASELEAYVGDFKSGELGVVYRLRSVQGKLNLVEICEASGVPRTGMPMAVALRPTILDEFEIPSQGIGIHFSRDAQKIVSGFGLNAGRTSGIEFIRTAELGNRSTTF